MRILFLGDIIGLPGCNAVNIHLPKIIKKHQIDFVIVNGENCAESGMGITEDIANSLFESEPGMSDKIIMVPRDDKRVL